MDTPWNTAVVVLTEPKWRAVTSAYIEIMLAVEAGRLAFKTERLAARRRGIAPFIKRGISNTDGKEKANMTSGGEAKLLVTLTITLESAVSRLAMRG